MTRAADAFAFGLSVVTCLYLIGHLVYAAVRLTP